MDTATQLITEHLDTWTTTVQTKTSAGRGGGSKRELYGIKKLRELILELAVRGLLVPQDPNDETASDLLKQATAERKRLQKAKVIKTIVPTPIAPEEHPYKLPKTWCWARFPELCHYSPGKTPSTKNPIFWESEFSNSGIPWVSIADMEHFGTIEKTSKRVTNAAAEKVFKSDPAKEGSILMSFKLTVGKIARLATDAYHNEAILSVNPFSGILNDYIFKFLPMRAQAGNTKKAIMGNTLNATSLGLLLIPLPPLAEQQRIVAKVDELMALCDRLEQEQSNHIETHETLVKILLDALTESASNPAQFQEAWQRIAANFDTLFTAESSIEQLKQSILQLAVMGKLVPQVPDDEPAAELLKKIAAEKEKLVKEGKIKKQKKLPEVAEGEIHHTIPSNWAHCRLNDIIQISSGDGLTAANMAKDGKIPVYGGNGVNGYHDKANVDKKTLTIGRVGYYCGAVHVTPEKAWVTDNAFITKFPEKHIFLDYLEWLLKATNLKENENATAQPVISGKKLYPIVVSLPPLAEQHRIVAKVAELMALCDTLKAKLQSSQATQLKLTDSLVAQAVG